ncbi:hypothetical protein JMM81_12435 [Bacillus sp. V3B]|uniref:hypothetical protein n=1 Tax=Bacillus sp. V3B TaxID=2804915 RepID=UPI00210EE3DE|nr:hypothetical protein [Bacillus sp. V3B]MCQ6275763.1 hypothetical protein [Bacillus sp. V3B]
MSVLSNHEQKILNKVETLLLEQQVSNLENTLSDTISFFSMVLALGAILFAVLIVVASWWLNRLFNKKLIQVEVAEQNATNNLLELQQIKDDVNQKYERINEMHEFVKSKKGKIEEIIEDHENLEKWIMFLEEKINILDNGQKFLILIDEVERKLKTITKSDIENFYVDEFEGPPESQFESSKKYYTEAKNKFLTMQKKTYMIEDFVLDNEMEYEPLSGEIISEFEEAKGFLEELNKIKKD